MAAKLSVIFYILLCLEVGIVLTLLPWYSPFGLGEWGDNFFLLKTGWEGLQHAVASGWVRGAFSGLGLLSIGVAIWEIVHFNQTVSALQAAPPPKTSAATKNVIQPPAANYLPDNERGNERDQQPVQ